MSQDDPIRPVSDEEVSRALGIAGEINQILTERRCAPKSLLISADNPYGWPLESALDKLRQELTVRNAALEKSSFPLARTLIDNNTVIILLLQQAAAFQGDSMRALSGMGIDLEVTFWTTTGGRV